MAKLPKPLGVVPLGDLAAYVEFSRTLDLEINSVAQRLAAAIVARGAPGVRDVVPALGGVALHFDPAFDGDAAKTAAELVEQCMKKLPDADDLGREIEVPVCYDPEFALDLDEVSSKTKIPPQEIVKRHAGGDEYRVLMVGFSPGHPYIGGLDPKLSVPRRATPRAQVPAGSVAIANLQTVVYPYEIPGGWNVIGRTPLVAFDASRGAPSLFAPGDRVRFHAIDRREYDLRKESA